jgi:predicted branched-subunit amino acid permease
MATMTPAMTIPETSGSGTFRDGFVAMLPFWAGAIPSGIAFGAAARADGLHGGIAQLMSLLVFSAPAQMSTLAHGGLDQSVFVLLITVLALNAHLPLLGAEIRRQCAPSRRRQLTGAFLLTDGAFGVAAARGRLTLPVLTGAGTSMYLGWNLGTLLGLALGAALPGTARTGIDLVIPLTFVAVLVPMLRTRVNLVIAVVAGATAIVAIHVVPAGIAVLLAGLVGLAIGARGDRRG